MITSASEAFFFFIIPDSHLRLLRVCGTPAMWGLREHQAPGQRTGPRPCTSRVDTAFINDRSQEFNYSSYYS